MEDRHLEHIEVFQGFKCKVQLIRGICAGDCAIAFVYVCQAAVVGCSGVDFYVDVLQATQSNKVRTSSQLSRDTQLTGNLVGTQHAQAPGLFGFGASVRFYFPERPVSAK